MKNKLVSPINGSELSLTEKENIFYSESDGLYYRQDSNNKIIPLTSPINASALSLTDKENIFIVNLMVYIIGKILITK